MSLVIEILLFILLIYGLVLSVTSHYDSWVPGEHSYHSLHNGLETSKDLIEEWTVEVDGGDQVAQLIALQLGYEFGGPVLGFPNTYTFRAYEHYKQRRTPTQHTNALESDSRIKWVEQLFVKSRVKRYPPYDPDREVHRVKRIENPQDTNSSQTGREKRDAFRRTALFNDELWGYQWYLQDTRTNQDLPRLDLNVLPVYQMGINGRGVRVSVLDDGLEYNHTDLRDNYQDTRTNQDLPRLDLNVLPVYQMGINGRGVRVSVLDDGLEYNHTDLRDNYDPEISWDCNDHDPDPYPIQDEQNRNSHGTRCAGEIVMTANNGKCGVGVSFGAKVGGVRMLDGRITDRIEGEAIGKLKLISLVLCCPGTFDRHVEHEMPCADRLAGCQCKNEHSPLTWLVGYAWDKVDIYSASWGPNDDGRTVEGPGRLAVEALKRGVTKGRDGKGCIYVWANGNGGGHSDNCNCDGYSSSIYTISIGSASQQGLFPWYGEICSSTLATAYSSGAYKDQKIATTDINDSCTLKHTGTSAAAPLAAGIIALALQANAGFRFDIRFGFGLLNAASLVKSALNWTTVPDKFICRIETPRLNEADSKITTKKSVNIQIYVENCGVNYIEHVELIVNAEYKRRGALEIYLTSPQGTKVQLLSARPRDTSTAGFVNWPLTSVATWGESPDGVWRATFEDLTNEQNTGKIGPLILVLHGTKDMPTQMRNGPRIYNFGYNNEIPSMFDYFDFDDPSENRVNIDENVLLNIDTDLIIDEIEEELRRNHHSKSFMLP
ncbi:Neuroendocrine convertase 1 [Papilio machaon]|uniref:Neuroendocrine convertase 1 n=1 Tax=Papilio machaon TaxID=76193 RepID=A0A194RAZ7_PAPMA|nr:Neuroendocrine convertase 1 [Papilio machaon]